MKEEYADSNQHVTRKAISRCGIVSGGRANLVVGVTAEVRRIVEAKYVNERPTSGFIKRIRLRRKIKREIAELVAKKMLEVSSESMF